MHAASLRSLALLGNGLRPHVQVGSLCRPDGGRYADRRATELQAWCSDILDSMLPEIDKEAVLARIPSAVTDHRFFIHDPSGPRDSLGAVDFLLKESLDEEEIAVGRRFADAFEFAHNRFRELKEKEDQNCELTIQNALERVRARVLGLQRSNELNEVISVMFEQFRGLGHDLVHAGIIVYDEASATREWWVEFGDGRKLHRKTPAYLTPGSRLQEVTEESGRAQDTGAAWFVLDQEGEVLFRWLRELLEAAGSSEREIVEVLRGTPERVVQHRVFHERGYVAFGLEQRLSDDDLAVAKRFTDVFDFAYDRFLELKTLEAQNRELQVEGALERVRSRAQGMRSSDDIGEVTTQLFREFNDLGIPVRRSGIWILDAEPGKGEIWLTEPTGEIRKGLPFETSAMLEHPASAKEYEAFKRGDRVLHQNYTIPQSVDMVTFFFDRLSYPVEYKEETAEEVEKILGAAYPGGVQSYQVFFPQGFLELRRQEPLTEGEVDIACRFAGVFWFTYSRMQEIAKVEKEVRQAERRAAADRVRAEIAIMRTSADLERVTPLIWKELTQVGVSFFRCGVFIIDEEEQQVRAFLANPEGAPLAAMNLPIDSPDLRLAFIGDAVRHWREGKIYVDQWDQQTFAETMQVMIDQGQPIDRKQYMGGSEPLESLALQMVPFAQGLLYVGSAESLSPEDVDLVRELAAAFSVAYARFLDFQQLEAQNIQIQEANRLKSDFLARMSHDLRTPMNAIIGYTRILLRQVKDILNDRQYRNLDNIQISANNLLSLINDILDLSKVEAGRIDIKPEAVDLKQLATECIASVASLVKPGVQLEQQLEDVNPTHTDADRIRRVVMNLLSNALKFTEQGRITVSSKSVEGWVELSVADTGSGIPPEDLPHIFDEFRQVESEGGKTQEGTGLGLSIAKKSVELLGGMIEVESEVGKGTKFTIRIQDYQEKNGE